MKKKDIGLTVTMCVVLALVTLTWGISFCVAKKFWGEPENIGMGGDLFGAVGALFSGWAFVGVLWAILLQRKSLQIQHDDLKATQLEMKQAREAHEESAETLKAQVEATHLQIRTQALTTMIEIPLKINSPAVGAHHREIHNLMTKGFNKYVEELEAISKQLKNKDEETQG